MYGKSYRYVFAVMMRCAKSRTIQVTPVSDIFARAVSYSRYHPENSLKTVQIT